MTSLIHNACSQALSRQGAILFPLAIALFGRGRFAVLCFVKDSGVVGSYNSLDVRHAALT